MKPKDFKSPFSWEERYVTVKDRVWLVPASMPTYDNYLFPGWNHPDFFGNNNPVNVEYCSGNGTWVAERAAMDPMTNWVAVEKKFERVRKIWSKVKNRGLSNLLVVCGEAFTVTKHYFPAASVASVYINFPDPWPKRRHAKHRLFQPAFVEELYRTLVEKGSITLVTDDPDYSGLASAEMLSHPSFESRYPAPYYVTDKDNYGTSYFEQLWRDKGRVIRYHQFDKR